MVQGIDQMLSLFVRVDDEISLYTQSSKARARIAKHGAILKMGEQRKGNKETRQELPCVHDLPEVEALLAQNEHLSGHRLCLSINWWGTLCHTIVHWTLTGMSKRRVTKTFYNPITAIHPPRTVREGSDSLVIRIGESVRTPSAELRLSLSQAVLQATGINKNLMT